MPVSGRLQMGMRQIQSKLKFTQNRTKKKLSTKRIKTKKETIELTLNAICLLIDSENFILNRVAARKKNTHTHIKF